MTPISRKILQTSGALIALSMLSACGSIPRSGGEIADTLSDVGAKTLELGGRAVASTRDFLHLHDEASHGDVIAQGGVDSNSLQTDTLDGELNMAGMETETTLLDGDSDVIIEAAESNIIVRQPLEGALEGTDLADNTDFGLQDPTLETQTTLAMDSPDPLAADPLAAAAPATTSAQSVATSDLIHEVQSQENLWDIAKATTGDANNWHVLADINNLAPNASVFPGQELTIPADMIKPGYLKDASTAAAVGASPASVAPIETASIDTERLIIPEDGTQADNTLADADAVDITAGAQRFKVGPGETLWNLAKRTTGDATNWKSIAAQNNFSEKQAITVYPGQTVYVPSTMVKNIQGEADNSTVATAAPAKQAVKTESATAPELDGTDTEALAAAAAVLASSASILDDAAPIKIVEAKFQEEETGTVALETTELSKEANQQLNNNAAAQIMVSGTYYPKAIYNEADFSSSLLMRVSPGTKLSVSKAVGPWYQVMTEKGVGYVHTRDIR
ncbi:MAG: LysM peptidoglycan-binding domain-containing protein [Granulosicoccaceae bacterium]